MASVALAPSQPVQQQALQVSSNEYPYATPERAMLEQGRRRSLHPTQEKGSGIMSFPLHPLDEHEMLMRREMEKEREREAEKAKREKEVGRMFAWAFGGVK